MSFEMSCANCDGRLMVETLGIVVACPHCGTHLSIPSEIPGIADGERPVISFTDDDEDDEDDHSTNAKSTWIPPVSGDESAGSFPDFSRASGAALDKAASESNVLVSEPEAETDVPSAVEVKDADPSAVMPAIVTDSAVAGPISSFPVLEDPNPKSPPQTDDRKTSEPKPPTPVSEKSSDLSPAMPVILTDDGESAAAESGFPALEDAPPIAPAPKAAAANPAKPEVSETESAQPPKKPADKKKSVYDSVYDRRGKTIPKPVFQAWLSYTIIMSAGLAMAIYYIFTSTASNLESLPDVKPRETKTGKVERILVPEKADMPAGHTLALHETQRFGNIEVTPMKVTRGDLSFVHYADKSRTRSPDGPVLKLWLKFKNVSTDQTIAPLDNELLFYRNFRNDRKIGAWANNFVCKANDKSKDGDLVLAYDHLTTGDYDIKDQHLEAKLKPGQETTIFIPTEAGHLDRLTGDLIWRVHIRKGYSPKNYGVTTVFEVEFPSNAIRPESSKA